MDQYGAQTAQIRAFLRARRPKSALAVVVLNAPLTQKALWILGILALIALSPRDELVAAVVSML